jgi:hypothetical protein
MTARYSSVLIGRVIRSRRQFLGAAGAALGTLLCERFAQASLARGLTLRQLVRASGHALVATPLESRSLWATFGTRRVIVTDTRVRIDELLALDPPADSELWVRVLGGVVGDLGQRVEGQAELVLGKSTTLFLTRENAAVSYVAGAAQGHYPLLPDAKATLRHRPSPHVPELLRPERSAVATLTGTTLAEARELVRAAAP